YIGLHRPTSAYIGLHRPTSAYIGLHRPTSAYIGLHRPILACDAASTAYEKERHMSARDATTPATSLAEMPRRYDPAEMEPRMQAFWQERRVYDFQPESNAPIYSIDTPPPTVSGNLHLGHVYSFSQTDFIARFWRLNGYNVFYPMGYDDNGLPTERLVEKRQRVTAAQIGRSAFIQRCLEVSEEAERHYRA